MKDRRPLRPALVLLGLVACAGPAFAQKKSELEIRSDIAFARGLAERFRYVDLAESVLRELEKGDVGKELGEELGLAQCDIYAEGAKREADPVKRLELYEKAIDAYKRYIEGHPFSEHLAQAQRSYVDLSNSFGRVLELQLEDAVGEEAQALREKIRQELEDGLQRTGDLIEALKNIPEPSAQETNDLYRLMLNRGQMLLTLAKVSEEGTFFFSQAEQTLEQLALEAGETTGWGLNAYLLLAKVKLARGEPGEAAAFVEYVVDSAIPFEEEARREVVGWSELDADSKQRRWALVELGTGDLLDAVASSGQSAKAMKWALHYYNTWKREGFTLSPLGYLSLLNVARTLLDAGGFVGTTATGDLRWFPSVEEMEKAGITGRRNQRGALDLALSIAQQVNKDNKGNTLQVRAQKLISDVINRPGVSVAPDVLFEAAQGEYYARNYPEALDALKGVMRALDAQDEATRQLFTPKVLWHIGSSLRRMERTLEAAMAHREAATNWKGDPEYQTRNAQDYYSAMSELRRASPGDQVVEELWLQAEGLAAAAGTDDADTITWRQAERSYGEGDYAAARAKYLELAEGADLYEKARSKAALTLYKQGDLDGAQQEFQKYLEEYVKSPDNPATSPTKQGARQEATAQATFYMGRIAYEQNRYEDVVRWLSDYEQQFPNQTSYAPPALYMVVLSQLNQKDITAATKVYDRLRAAFPTHQNTGDAALQIYGAFKAEKERVQSDGDAARTAEITRQMAEFLHTYNELTPKPDFTFLRVESRLWMELEEWEKAEEALRLIVQAFADDASKAKDLELYVLPDLGESLLAQKEVPQAFEVLDPLVPAPDDEEDTRKPASRVVIDWCRSIGGWVEGDARNMVEIPGVGGAERLEKATRYWVQLEGTEEKWSCPWYELKFLTAYAYYQWGQLDSAKLETAKKVIADLRQLAEDPNFEEVEKQCGEVLRRRFLWLWDKVQ